MITNFEIVGPYLAALMMSLGAVCILVWGVFSGAFHGAGAALSEDQFVLTLTGPKMIAWPDRSAGVRGELAQRAALQHFALASRPSRPRAF